METTYTLIILNQQGGSEQTDHASKAEVRRQIRTWDAKEMTARVFVGSECIYDGRALSF